MNLDQSERQTTYMERFLYFLLDYMDEALDKLPEYERFKAMPQEVQQEVKEATRQVLIRTWLEFAFDSAEKYWRAELRRRRGDEQGRPAMPEAEFREKLEHALQEHPNATRWDLAEALSMDRRTVARSAKRWGITLPTRRSRSSRISKRVRTKSGGA